MLPALTLLVPASVLMIIGLGYSWTLAFGTIFVALTAFIWMRNVTKRDDQRLLQILLKWRLRGFNRTQNFWQCISYAPLDCRRKKR